MRKNFLTKSTTAFTLAVLGSAILSSCTKDIKQEPQASDEQMPAVADKAPGTSYVPGEVLVKFKQSSTANGRSSALSRIAGSVEEKIVTATMERFGDNEGVSVVSTKLDVMDAIAKLKENPDVVYAEPNYIYNHEATSNDTYYTNGSLWGMYGDGTSPANQYGSQAGEAWAAGHTGSKSVVVGIIDEGAMYNHEDLAGNFWTNPYDPVDGIDNDGNGYVDDVHGWDFANNDNTTFDGSSDDHGTHVSGTIGGIGGNGKGVAGVNWAVTLISAKFLGRNGGTTANAIKAVDYITDLKTRHGLNLVATNNSWGGGGFSQALQDAIERANAADILFVAAAGNGGSDGVGDNNDAVANYPSNYPNSNIIAVAALTSSGGLASYSNYGATQVDIGSPGSGIYSTVPTKSGGSGYSSYSGTSMATPHVTGACALYASTHAGATGATIKNAILSSAVPTASLSGKCVTGGRLNVSGF
jgi:subtilisin family serine protease